VILRIYEEKWTRSFPGSRPILFPFFFGNARSCSTLHRIIRRDL